MKKLLVLAGSSSSKSINKQLAEWAGTQVSGAQAEVIDLNDYALPVFSVDLEEAEGIPEKAKSFVSKIENSDGVILSLAEHNGSYASAFKNLLDWASRHKQKLWSEKAMLLLSTSPGGRGGASVMGAAKSTFPHMGANVTATFSLPSFPKNFVKGEGISDADLKKEFDSARDSFAKVVG